MRGGEGVPRLRARRGDVGIAPYETTTEKPCVESVLCPAREDNSSVTASP